MGYIRLVVFSKNAAKDMSAALQDLSAEGIESVILDLRDNVGGVIFSGYEVGPCERQSSFLGADEEHFAAQDSSKV